MRTFSWMKVWLVISFLQAANCSVVGELAVQEEVGHLQVGRVLGQLLDRVAPVAQDARFAVEVGDGALAGGGRHEARGRRTRRRGGASTIPTAETPPFMIGISIDSPLRLSVIVMLSATWAILPIPAGFDGDPMTAHGLRSRRPLVPSRRAARGRLDQVLGAIWRTSLSEVPVGSVCPAGRTMATVSW